MKLDITTESAQNLLVFFGRAWRTADETGEYERIRGVLNAGLQRMQMEAAIEASAEPEPDSPA